MEIAALLVIWAISIPLCVRFAKKIGSNQVVAGLAGLAAPILSPILYWYVASNKKEGKIDRNEIFRQIGVAAVALIALYWVVSWFR